MGKEQNNFGRSSVAAASQRLSPSKPIKVDANIIQQALISDGFKIKVSPWSGVYAILQFEEIELIQIFWELKVLDTWFDDFDILSRFQTEYKLKVWASLGNFPLATWNDQVFKSIASRWGKVLKIDEDTTLRNRFDCSRVLMGVKCFSEVPNTINLFINGVRYSISISVSEYEDERRWIDEEDPKGQQFESPSDFVEKVDCCRLEVQGRTGSAQAATVISRNKKEVIENPDFNDACFGNEKTSCLESRMKK
ncbi:hypothetical protein V6N13_088464 [Hibiscus sabdariffa]